MRFPHMNVFQRRNVQETSTLQVSFGTQMKANFWSHQLKVCLVVRRLIQDQFNKRWSVWFWLWGRMGYKQTATLTIWLLQLMQFGLVDILKLCCEFVWTLTNGCHEYLFEKNNTIILNNFKHMFHTLKYYNILNTEAKILNLYFSLRIYVFFLPFSYVAVWKCTSCWMENAQDGRAVEHVMYLQLSCQGQLWAMTEEFNANVSKKPKPVQWRTFGLTPIKVHSPRFYMPGMKCVIIYKYFGT